MCLLRKIDMKIEWIQIEAELQDRCSSKKLGLVVFFDLVYQVH